MFPTSDDCRDGESVKFDIRKNCANRLKTKIEYLLLIFFFRF